MLMLQTVLEFLDHYRKCKTVRKNKANHGSLIFIYALQIFWCSLLLVISVVQQVKKKKKCF